jgi:hypothetical protein
MRILRKGATGDAVRLLQERLLAKGFEPGRVDGSFGPRTDTAVRQFQASHNLKVDGIVGDKTWALLLAEGTATIPPNLLEEERRWLRKQIPGGLTGARIAVLDAAIETLGWREQPDGSNDGPGVGLISRGWYPPGQRCPPWCALAVSYWLKKGLNVGAWTEIPFGARLAAVSEIERWGRQNDRLVRAMASTVVEAASIFTMSRSGSSSDTTPQPGAGHTGLVVRDDGSHVITIEGNTTNAVGSRRRRKTTLGAFLRWW